MKPASYIYIYIGVLARESADRAWRPNDGWLVIGVWLIDTDRLTAGGGNGLEASDMALAKAMVITLVPWWKWSFRISKSFMSSRLERTIIFPHISSHLQPF